MSLALLASCGVRVGTRVRVGVRVGRDGVEVDGTNVSVMVGEIGVSVTGKVVAVSDTLGVTSAAGCTRQQKAGKR